MSRSPLIIRILALATLCAPAFAADSVQESVDLGLRLEHESAVVKQLQERLRMAESQFDHMPGQPVPRRVRGPDVALLKNTPASVIEENLCVERTVTESGLVYRVSAKNVTTLQVLEAVSRTSSLPLELHPDVGRAPMLGRLWLDLYSVELAELLEIVGGCQGVTVTADSKGIMVGPLTAASPTPLRKRLRQMAANAYMDALVKYPDCPKAPAAYLGLAKFYVSEGFADAAAQALQRITDRYPTDPVSGPALMLMGDCMDSLGRYPAARTAYYRHVDTHPGAPDLPLALMKIGEAWIKEDRWTQAVPVFESILREHPESRQAPMARLRLAEGMSREGQYERAIEQFRILESSKESGPLGDGLKLMLADCYTRLKRHGQARLCLQEAVRSSSDADTAERAYYALGDSLLADGKAVDALEAYQGAMGRFPEGSQRDLAPLRLARVHAAMGLLNEAQRELTAVPDSAFAAPDARELILSLARARLECADHAWVLAILHDRRWPHDAETDPVLLTLEAQALWLAGSPDMALERATSGAKLAHDDAVRAEACRIAGDCFTARKDIIRAAMAYGGRIE